MIHAWDPVVAAGMVDLPLSTAAQLEHLHISLDGNVQDRFSAVLASREASHPQHTSNGVARRPRRWLCV